MISNDGHPTVATANMMACLPVSPPSYDGNTPICEISDANVSADGFTTNTPALNLSGGKKSGAAAKLCGTPKSYGIRMRDE
jgi:hypothetical protein